MKPRLFSPLFALAAAALALLAAGCGKSGSGPGRNPLLLRVGHFPNITHAQALVARALAAEGKGWFEERLGPGVKIEWFTYNAGPSAIEAIFADSIDVTYVGPNPVLNGYIRARGDEVRVVSGAALGGAALVVQSDGRIAQPADFRGKKVATPQLGNTQDIACRAWMTKQGFRVTLLGGDVNVIPTENPDQLDLFRRGELDAAWTVEPWVSRLELEANGKIFLQQDEAIATVVAASVQALERKRELVRKFVQANAELTDWINQNPEEAQRLVRAELKVLTRSEIKAATCARAWSRLRFSVNVSRPQFEALVVEAQSAGFLHSSFTSLDKLFAVP